MPLVAARGDFTASPTKFRNGGGYTSVTYRKPTGQFVSARIIGPGTASGIKIRLEGTGAPAVRILDNVALMTAKTQTGVYLNRRGP
jgi:hypothetical protein